MCVSHFHNLKLKITSDKIRFQNENQSEDLSNRRNVLGDQREDLGDQKNDLGDKRKYLNHTSEVKANMLGGAHPAACRA